MLQESKSTERGSHILDPVETPVGRIGLATCYDLRFPEMSVLLRKKGAEILTFPSAFTSTTGLHHWFPILKARAIENQCFVAAAAQIGKHNPASSTRESFGGSCIIDPWGQVLAQCSTVYGDEAKVVGQVMKLEEDSVHCELAMATIDHLQLKMIRRDMPVFEHRRDDIYKLDLVSH